MRYLITLLIALSVFGVVYIAGNPRCMLIVLASLVVTFISNTYDDYMSRRKK